ncbi:MAG: sulfotransferase [Desulfocapsaceae bacterium]|nr:sulfotransferase [Desulfocapsaceae bacterium]
MEIKLSSQALINQAMEKTGLADFGGQTFTEGLNVLIDSLKNDIDLPEGTADFFYNQILQILINRLDVTQYIKDHPEVLEEKIEKPIFIVGLPRSGTTILHTLMALDPTSRFLRNYESAGSICPPSEIIPDSVDPRITTYHESMEGIFTLAPVLRGINGINFMAHGSAECQNLMAHEFVHLGWSCGSSLFTHGSWVSECNMNKAYQWHRLLIQLLQWKLPNERLVLKAPMHLFGLDHLLETYPDAKIVFTHRNPLEAMVSGVSMVYHWTEFTAGKADIQAIANWYPDLWAKGLKRALKVLETVNPAQLVHILHRDITESPVETVEKIYGKFELRFSKAFKKRMITWLNDNPRSKFGRHENLQFVKNHLDAAKEQERFQFYQDRFEMW